MVRKPRTIYIAGKITGLPKDEYLTAFKYWEHVLRRTYPGVMIINPAEILDPLEGLSQEQFMCICKGMLDTCDEVYFMPGYEKSEGAKQEYDYALENGITRCLIIVDVESQKGTKE